MLAIDETNSKDIEMTGLDEDGYVTEWIPRKRRLINLHEVFPDEDEWLKGGVDGYNAFFWESCKLAFREAAERWGTRLERLSRWLQKPSKK